MKHILLLLITITALSSCKITKQRCDELYPPIAYTKTDSIITVTERIHDTTVVVQPDNSYIDVIFECDSLNQVLVRQVLKLNGDRSKSKVQFENTGKRLKAMFQTTCDSMSIYIAMKSLDTSLTVRSNSVEVRTINTPYKPTKKQMFVLSVGGWCIGIVGLQLLLLVLYAGFRIAKVSSPMGAATELLAKANPVKWFRKVWPCS